MWCTCITYLLNVHYDFRKSGILSNYTSLYASFTGPLLNVVLSVMIFLGKRLNGNDEHSPMQPIAATKCQAGSSFILVNFATNPATVAGKTQHGEHSN